MDQSMEDMKWDMGGAATVTGVIEAAALSKLIASSAWSSGIELKVVYQVQWNDIEIAKAEADWVLTEDSYVMSGTSQTVGILNKIRGFLLDFISSELGQINDPIFLSGTEKFP